MGNDYTADVIADPHPFLRANSGSDPEPPSKFHAGMHINAHRRGGRRQDGRFTAEPHVADTGHEAAVAGTFCKSGSLET